MNKIHNKQKICLNNTTILVTGGAGFIGAHLIMRIIREADNVRIINIDDINDYYDPELKHYRVSLISELADRFKVEHIFLKESIGDKNTVSSLFEQYRPDIVVNLAAQAGVRYSIDHSDKYIDSNIIGFYNILEACKGYSVKHLVYASSSSVYGDNTKVPFSEEDNVDHPLSIYAATKKTNELLAYCYSKLYNIPSTGLRFFTVYGPLGRPDMFYFSATSKLIAGEKIQIFNYGKMERDFTYIDDIVEGIMRVIQGAPQKIIGEDGLPVAPYSIYNIGGSNPEKLLDFIAVLQSELVESGLLPKDYDFEEHRELVGMQPGDFKVTYANTSALETDYGFKPTICIQDGLHSFVHWYKDYYYR